MLPLYVVVQSRISIKIAQPYVVLRTASRLLAIRSHGRSLGVLLWVIENRSIACASGVTPGKASFPQPSGTVYAPTCCVIDSSLTMADIPPQDMIQSTSATQRRAARCLASAAEPLLDNDSRQICHQSPWSRIDSPSSF